MELREIKNEERPKCQQCGKPLVWVRNSTYYIDIYAWDFDCECVDTDILKPDHVFKAPM